VYFDLVFVLSRLLCSFTALGLLITFGGLNKVTMLNSVFRALPTRVSNYLTASYFTGGLET
jgi:hypothetical protein